MATLAGLQIRLHKLNADKHSPASSARSAKRLVSGDAYLRSTCAIGSADQPKWPLLNIHCTRRFWESVMGSMQKRATLENRKLSSSISLTLFGFLGFSGNLVLRFHWLYLAFWDFQAIVSSIFADLFWYFTICSQFRLIVSCFWYFDCFILCCSIKYWLMS